MRDRGGRRAGSFGRQPGPSVRGRVAMVARMADRVLQGMIPPKRRRICFASIPDCTDNAYYLYRYLLENRSGYEFVWLVRSRRSQQRIREQFEQSGRADRHVLVVRSWRSPVAYLSFIRSGIVFHTHGAFSFSKSSRRRTVVSLWHGMPVKTIRALHAGDTGLHPVHGDLHVATSRFFRYVIAAAFEVPATTVLVSGLPRCDVLKGGMRPEEERPALLRRLGLEPDRPLILWLPTHRVEADADPDAQQGSFLDDIDEDLFDGLVSHARRRRCQLVVKLHPFDALNDEVLPESLRQTGVTTLSSTQWEESGVQLYDLVAATDGLLTDISSVAIDYLHTARPIAFLGFDPSTYSRQTVLPVDLLVRAAAVESIHTAEDVAAFVDSVASGDRSATRGSVMPELLNEDGDLFSSERIAAEIGI